MTIRKYPKISLHNRCTCKAPPLQFEKFIFSNGKGRPSGHAYKGTCKSCGLLRAWYDGDNYISIVNKVDTIVK